MTRRDKVLRALQAGGLYGATTAELCQPDVGGVRFGGRILELRELGYTITAERIREGSFRYRLVGEPDASGPVRGCPGAAVDDVVDQALLDEAEQLERRHGVGGGWSSS